MDLVAWTLAEVPPFQALSYAWGDPDPQTEICCSGLGATIGPNLFSALRHLRPATPYFVQWIWADALCINQEDVTERSEQVRMTGHLALSLFSVSSSFLFPSCPS